MNDSAVLEQMLTTIITNQDAMSRKQETQAGDISEIKSSMVEIVRIEERQANQKEALGRMGRKLDTLDERVDKQDIAINTVKNQVATSAARVGAIATGIATVVTGGLVASLNHFW